MSEADLFIVGNVPHDWLFADGRVSAVCHHGGAGTTAIGLKNGVPTIVVPFFGDQPFQVCCYDWILPNLIDADSLTPPFRARW